MANDIYLIGGIGSEVTLSSVIRLVNESDKDKPLNVHIHSGGGSVFEGIAIYNYLKNLEQEVNTSSSGLVASIATIPFLAGRKETRSINTLDNFLIHLPIGGKPGNAEQHEKSAEQLRDVEDKLSDIYAKETDITKEEALVLMKDDKFLDVEFLKEKGFVSNIIEFKAVANLYNKNKDMNDNVTKEEVEKQFDTFWDKLKALLPSKSPDNKVVQDVNGTEINFINLSENEKALVGEEATIDNKKATGDFTMENGDVWTFVNGKFDKILESKEETEVEKLTNQVENLTNQLQTSAETLTESQDEVKALNTKVDEIKVSFTEMKASITSKFDYDGTQDPNTQEPQNSDSRTNFKSKVKK
ncbi:MAG: Clp protease ClpP [Gammaproteobacteria bacterium]|nr:Clp protease ClpP [Gammaproteobacteria bacterium]